MGFLTTLIGWLGCNQGHYFYVDPRHVLPFRLFRVAWLKHWYINRIDDVVEWGLSWLGATCWRFCRKTQKEPAKCLYSVCILCTVYSFPPCGWNLWGWPAISVSTWQQFRVGQIVWFGCLSAISQLASRLEEGGGVWQLVSIALHRLTLPGPGGESREGGSVPSPWAGSRL
jgi:hypothetical protein